MNGETWLSGFNDETCVTYFSEEAEHQMELSFDHRSSERRAPLARIEIGNILHDTHLIIIRVVRVVQCNPIISRKRFPLRSLCKDTSNSHLHIWSFL